MKSVNPKITIVCNKGNQIPLVITAVKKGDTVRIVLKGSIYSWSSASSYDVGKVLKEFKTAGTTKADIYVSTGGGDCFEAQEILNLIDDNFKPENVMVRVGALCASAGTRFLTSYYSVAKKNSKFMIHKPMGNPSGNEDQIESGLKLIKDMTLEYKKAYAKKMNKTEDEIEQLWAKGDYWMTAEEAKADGLINEIEDEDEVIDATAHLQLVACGAPNVPNIKSNKTETKRMELSVLAARLGLPATATQEQVDAKLTNVIADANKVAGLVQASVDKAKADEAAKKKNILDTAEQDKKITAKQRPHLESMSVEALEGFMEMQKPITAISDALGGASGAQNASQAKWTFADYQEKDEAAFEKLPEAKQKELIEAHYKE